MYARKSVDVVVLSKKDQQLSTDIRSIINLTQQMAGFVSYMS